ncbi:MAG: hypothetical protein JST28_03275 [Acidobacteria bacterium]|nr:hypothetical protein [Acidobacteriota bacterium]
MHKLLVDTVKRRASEARRKTMPLNDLAKVLDTLRTSPSADARNGAAWVLHDQHFPKAASHLRAAALHDQDPSVREAAIRQCINDRWRVTVNATERPERTELRKR